MKTKPFAIILGIPLLFTACATHCDTNIPADMADYIPSIEGKVLTYVNDDGDTLTMIGDMYYYTAGEDLEPCSKCQCESRIMQDYLLEKDGCTVFSSGYMVIESHERNVFGIHLSITGFNGHLELLTPSLHATFDNQGRFTSRDFGDTIVLTGEDLNDTAILVKGVGLVYANGYKLVPNTIQ